MNESKADSGKKCNCKGKLDKENVKEYYGKTLQGSQDLKTSACCSTGSDITPKIKEGLGKIDEEIIRRYYGCGSPLPPLLEGLRVVDLGCGTGRDTYLLSQFVGEKGEVIGVDMTEEQLMVAKKHVDSQMKRFGYSKPNVSFRLGNIEDLKSLDILDGSVDLVVSNCVLNLTSDKRKVFSEIFRVLKPGGELFFSDVFTGRRVPEHLYSDPVLHGECLSGSLYIEDFRRILQDIGYRDFRITSSRPLELKSKEVIDKIGMVDFYSMTIRAFKIDELEDLAEDYGQVATYRGTIPDCSHHFELDEQRHFLTGKPTLVCGNTASMLKDTRYREHFHVQGDRSVHFGAFEGSYPVLSRPENNDSTSGGCC